MKRRNFLLERDCGPFKEALAEVEVLERQSEFFPVESYTEAVQA